MPYLSPLHNLNRGRGVLTAVVWPEGPVVGRSPKKGLGLGESEFAGSIVLEGIVGMVVD